MRTILPIALAILFSGPALANPLLTSEFWRTATPNILEQAIIARVNVNARTGVVGYRFTILLSTAPGLPSSKPWCGRRQR
jgi:hypothetical protein